MNLTKTSEQGFTLIEVMIVVVIVGILAGLAVARFGEVARSSKEAEAGPMLRQIITLQERHFARDNSYALDITELEGGASLPESGTYYRYSIIEHVSGVCAVAEPNDLGEASKLRPRSMDADARLYENANCS